MQLIKATKTITTTQNLPFLIVVLAAILYSLTFSIIALNRFWQYEAWYYDFGIFAQAIYSVSRFQPPIIDHFVVGGNVIFADHLHPVIFLLSPLFWFTTNSEVLLVAQSLAVGLSSIFIYLTAQAVLKKSGWSLLLTGMYLSFIGLHFALISEFHEITLLPLPLSLFFYALVTKSTRLYIVATVAVLLVKESTFVLPAFFCLLQVIHSKGSWRKTNLVLLIGSILYGVAAIKVIIPFFSGGSYQYANTSTFSSIEKVVDSPLKLQTIWQTLASYGFLPLLAPELLPPVILNWVTRFSVESVSRHGMGLHYNAEVAPTLLFASIIAIKRLRKWLVKDAVVGVVVLCATLWSFYFSIFYLNSPVRLAVIPDFYRHTSSFKFLDDLVAQVPVEGSVMAQANLTPRLIHRNVKMLREDYERFSPDIIVVDARAEQNPNNFFGIGEPQVLFEKLASDPDYQVYYQQGDQIIYTKK